MGEFADYEYYKDVFHGRLIPWDCFPEASERAGAYLCYITQNRVLHQTERSAVRDAFCAAAEAYHTYATTTDKEVKSENTDGYSVSYVVERKDGQLREDVLRKKMYKAVYPYLVFTGLLGRRINNDHECRYDCL